MVEREILSEVLTRIYEAAAEGKITPDDRDKLMSKYKGEISRLDSSISYDQKVLSLYELEETRAELLKLFNEKFLELNRKIEAIRQNLGVCPKESLETVNPPPQINVVEKETRLSDVEKPPSPATPAASPSTRRTRADETLEKLRESLQEGIKKLEKMELEI